MNLTMSKYDIVNALVLKERYERYLEICTPNTGGTFRKIKRANLHACHRLLYRCPPEFRDGGEISFRSGNDAIEGVLPAGAIYDIIFIDPWHTFECSLRDLQEAFSMLSPRGTMVVHDCSPPSKEVASPQLRDGPWSGVTYCAYIEFLWSHPEVEYYTVNTDYGVGVVKKRNGDDNTRAGSGRATEIIEQWHRARADNNYDVFDFFSTHR